MTARRLRLWRLCAVLIVGAALWGLLAGREEYYGEEPPPLSAGLAKARLDGGQMMGVSSGGPPNELSRLNLGFRLNFKTARPDLLSRLPGLGRATVASGRERGFLHGHQSRRAEGLLIHYENMDKNDESRPSLDDL